MQAYPLGYDTARRVLTLGRAVFFGDSDADLPSGRSPLLRRDDLTPQFGYVGSRYADVRVLLLGINPGHGTQNIVRTATDGRMMPAHINFAEDPSPARFLEAQQKYKAECEHWHIWKRHCAAVIGAGKLSLEDVAYSNCLPWRSGSASNFSDFVARRAVELYAYPLIEELKPTLLIALGKRAAEILRLAGKTLPPLIVWNRAQVATEAVLRDRANAAAQVFTLLRRQQRG